MRILHVTQPTSGGVGRAVLGLAHAQHAAGLEVAVACPPGPLPDGLPDKQWRPWSSVREPARGIRAEARALRAIVGEHRPDVVHLHSSKAGLVGRLALRRRVRTVFQPHAWSFLAVEGRTREAAVRWERFATRWTDLTLFCSLREQHDGLAAGIAAPGRIVLNGVDLRRFRPPSDDDRNQARQALGLPGDAPVAVIAGRKSRQKGQDLALRVWPEVRAAAPGATLVLAGEGYADGSDPAAGVRTVAARNDVVPLLAAADLVLAPSRWEGLSLSLLEALACGRPVVAAEVAGAREALLDGPHPAAGAVVAPDDPEALAAATVVRLRDADLRRREAAAGRLRAERSFGEAATTGSVLDAYRLVTA